MDKLSGLLERFLLPLTEALDRSKIFNALRDSMLLTIPVVIIGSFALILSNIPFLDRVSPELYQGLRNFFLHINPVTLGILGLIVLIGVAFNYSRLNDVNPIYGIITALLSFLTITLFRMTGAATVDGNAVQNVTMQNILPTNVLGAQGILTALLVAFISVKIYSVLYHKNFVIKMPESVPPNVANSFTSLIPMMVTVLVFLVVRNLMLQTPYESVHNMIYTLITVPLTALGNSVFTILILTAIQQMLWFVGIHGTSILAAVWGPIEQTMMGANQAALLAGQELPYILSQPFRQVYGIGGAQGILAAVVAALIISKSKQMKTVSKLALTPGIFNIQEPFHFGAPSFMNPVLFLPYVFIPVLQVGIAYFACAVGLAPVPVIPVPWTTPIILSGLLSTNFNIMGAVLQIILFVIAVVIWIPFLKAVDNDYYRKEKAVAVNSEDVVQKPVRS